MGYVIVDIGAQAFWQRGSGAFLGSRQERPKNRSILKVFAEDDVAYLFEPEPRLYKNLLND